MKNKPKLPATGRPPSRAEKLKDLPHNRFRPVAVKAAPHEEIDTALVRNLTRNETTNLNEVDLPIKMNAATCLALCDALDAQARAFSDWGDPDGCISIRVVQPYAGPPKKKHAIEIMPGVHVNVDLHVRGHGDKCYVAFVSTPILRAAVTR
ncbi:MAG: hypothetical protein JNL21_07345 [Myxococcales bacterium]|nr:hypothetical protein [Myxococcales bacterium]